MKATFLLSLLFLSTCLTHAQPGMGSAIIPFHLDHNRILMDVTISSPDGTKKHVRAWVDNGDPGLSITTSLAHSLGIQPRHISANTGDTMARGTVLFLGGLRIDLSKMPVAETLPDMLSVGADMNIPATVLRHFDIIIDYPGKKITVSAPGAHKWFGTTVHANVNPRNGLIQLPGSIDGQSFNLALDIGTPICFISDRILADWQATHPAWPHMTGAISFANLWGLEGEPRGELVRIPAINYGGLSLSGVVAASFEKHRFEYFKDRAGLPTIGLIGADALLNYRIGIDYVHSKVYFQKTANHPPAHIDAVGLILRPQPGGRYSILGIANQQGQPSVPGARSGDLLVQIDHKPITGRTMGELWSLLRGTPGSTRTLTVERMGQRFDVQAIVYRFL